MIIEYGTVWDEQDEQDEVYLHYAVGEIDGFRYQYAVESHHKEMTRWDVEQIREAFKQQLIECNTYHDAPGRHQ